MIFHLLNWADWYTGGEALGVIFLEMYPENEFLVFSFKLLNLNFFRQAALTELMWTEIAWTVEKLLMLLFKLHEILIGGSILGYFGVKWTVWKSLRALAAPKGTS